MSDIDPLEQSHEPSVTFWLEQLKAGDSAAAGQLWQRYVERLIRFADRKLYELPRRVADEEDVVLSAFHGFLQGVEDGRFSRLDDRDDLWQVLAMLTQRKVIALRRYELAAKRGEGKVRGESALEASGLMSTAAPGLGQLAGYEPTPQFAAQATEELSRLLDEIGDGELRPIALAKLEGYTNQEIADKLGTNLRAIERKLRLIRHRWRQEFLP